METNEEIQKLVTGLFLPSIFALKETKPQKNEHHCQVEQLLQSPLQQQNKVLHTGGAEGRCTTALHVGFSLLGCIKVVMSSPQ